MPGVDLQARGAAMLNRGGVVIVRPKQSYLDWQPDWMTRGSCPTEMASRV